MNMIQNGVFFFEPLLVGMLILKSLLWFLNGSPKIPSKDFQAAELKMVLLLTAMLL